MNRARHPSRRAPPAGVALWPEPVLSTPGSPGTGVPLYPRPDPSQGVSKYPLPGGVPSNRGDGQVRHQKPGMDLRQRIDESHRQRLIDHLNNRGGRPGMHGLGSGNPTSMVIAPGASIDSRFSAGKPGIYRIRMRVEGIAISAPLTPYLGTGPFTTAIRAQGINGACTEVRYLRNENARDKNWADSAIRGVLNQSVTENLIHDRIFDVTVQIAASPSSAGGGGSGASSGDDWGMGAVQIGAGAALVILAAIAVGIAVTYPAAGKKIIEAVEFIGAAVVALVAGAAKKATENAIPLLIAVGVVAAGIWMLKKGGAKYAGKSFSF